MAHANPYNTGLDRNAANYTPLTPLSLLARTAYVCPERAAVIYGELSFNWAEVYARCRRLASALTARGIGVGDTVAAMLPNVPAMYEAHFGVPMTGAVLNTLNTRLDAEAIVDLIRRHRVTHYCGAPIVHNLLLNAPTAWKQGISHAVCCLVAGAAPPVPMIEGMEKIGFNITHAYGLTETYGPAALCAKHESWASLPLERRAELNGRQGEWYHAQ